MTDEAKDPLLVERDGPVMRIVLNRPERKNALTAAMVRTLTEAVTEASVDDETRVVLIRSEGGDFCSGIDLVESNRPGRGAAGGDRPKPRTGHLQRGFTVGAHRMIQAVFNAQVPVVAAVQGWAAGVGNALALSADFTIASETARFWVPFVTKGFTPDSGNSWLLPRLIGLARAKQMILKGEPVDGPTAERWGLVTRCVPQPQLDEVVRETVAELSEMATVSLGLAKSLVHGNLEAGLGLALQAEGVYEELAIRSDDFKEGIKAFMQKRSPDYTGW